MFFYIWFEIWPLKLIKFWSRAVIYSKIRCMCVCLRLFIQIWKIYLQIVNVWQVKKSDRKGDKTDIMNSQQGGFYDKKNMTTNVLFLCFFVAVWCMFIILITLHTHYFVGTYSKKDVCIAQNMGQFFETILANMWSCSRARVVSISFTLTFHSKTHEN